MERRNERGIRHKLYQGIQTDGATDDTPNQGESKGNEPLFLERGRGSAGHGGRGKVNEPERWVMNRYLYTGDFFTKLIPHFVPT